MKKVLFSLFLAAFLPVSAEALPLINVHLVSVSGPHSIAHEAKTVFKAAQKKLREAGVRTRIKRFTQLEDSAPDLTDIDNRNSRFHYWKDTARSRRWFKGVNQVHVMLPPITSGEQLFVGGLADECSKFSVSFLTEFNHLGESREAHSVCSVVHEAAHAAGAEHDDSGPNLMHPNALMFVGLTHGEGEQAMCNLGFNKQAKKQIQRCQRRDV